MVGDEKQFEKYWKNAKCSLRTIKSEYTVAEDKKRKAAAEKAASQASLLSASSAAAILIPNASESTSTSVLSSNLSVSASSVSGLTDAEQISMPSNVNN